jgi:excisionase family DNA binding protein
MSTDTHLPAQLTLTVEEAAALLGISRSHAYGLVRTGTLEAIRLGRTLKIPTRVIADLLGYTTQEDPADA